MRKLLGGFVLGVVVVLAVQFLFLTQGGMPVATQGGPMPLERFMASRALHAAMSRESGTPSPVPADAPNLLAGARVYRENCMVCHGTLGQKEPTPIARGMYPHPPQLLPPGEGVTDDPVGETHWKVHNGIRLTGMPAFQGTLSQAEEWQVSQLLHEADKLPDDVQAQLR
jgi:mono/diheme cytochrome c family protein